MLPAPFVPRVDHDLDTQNFEHFEEEGAAGSSANGQPLSANAKFLAKADPNFIGYTYKNWEAVTPGDAGVGLRAATASWLLGLLSCIRMGVQVAIQVQVAV